ncbi:hypothetical protein PWEIH_14901 [Listeria weihenstephanensis FSL R9-0317]|uniref:CPCC family cysteine-rich protein n=1 Tax=Listeria weihenstephanensis TaxID=1006155 RepID=UPI0003E88AD4|nr:CPCC family cysteine-rich protein [Listeria weihenstephanensis]EUJ35842.1 hypothetical protein PWEIH_14901 [Listeria weihenstephanensis FSL R9-0317]
MERQEALVLISQYDLEKLSIEKRRDLLEDWWGINAEEAEFHNLPEDLQSEIVEFEVPVFHFQDTKYNPLLLEAIKYGFIGVKNEYLAAYVSDILKKSVEVTGEEEKLLVCFCCSYLTIQERGMYDICPVCDWEDDGGDSLAHYSCPNHMTLLDGKQNFENTFKLEGISFGGIEKYYSE